MAEISELSSEHARRAASAAAGTYHKCGLGFQAHPNLPGVGIGNTGVIYYIGTIIGIICYIGTI